MAHVNIGADNADDAFYRYKMPKLQAKIEGRGNGIKTNIVNMVDVAKALSRPPSYTTKYFGCVLGAQSKFDEKTGTSTVNGAHDTAKLVQHLEGFIKTYVQCYGCGNPETEVIITKKQLINLKCAACGHVSEVDMRDKLTTFILKNPPEPKKKKGDKNMRRAEKERIEAGKALDEESKKSKKDKEKGEGKKKKKSSAVAEEQTQDKHEDDSPESSQKDEDDDDDDVEWQTDTSTEAAKQRIQEQLSAATANMVMLDAGEEEKGKKVPESPKSPVANGGPANGSASEKEGAANGDEEAEADEEKEPSAHEALVEELVDYIQTHKVAEVADFVAKKELNTELYIALVEALFNNIAKGFSKEVVKKKLVFAAVARDEAEQEKLVVGLEHFFAIKAGAAAKEIALVLKALYDEELLEEEVILAWYDSASKCPGLTADLAANIRELSDPFINWLKEAEEEDEDDE